MLIFALLHDAPPLGFAPTGPLAVAHVLLGFVALGAFHVGLRTVLVNQSRSQLRRERKVSDRLHDITAPTEQHFKDKRNAYVPAGSLALADAGQCCSQKETPPSPTTHKLPPSRRSPNLPLHLAPLPFAGGRTSRSRMSTDTRWSAASRDSSAAADGSAGIPQLQHSCRRLCGRLAKDRRVPHTILTARSRIPCSTVGSTPRLDRRRFGSETRRVRRSRGTAWRLPTRGWA